MASENYQYAGYVQDNWRATNKLTLNIRLALRRGNAPNRSLSTARTGSIRTWSRRSRYPASVLGWQLTSERRRGLRQSQDSAQICDTDWKDFQPRFGFAYQLVPKPWFAAATASTIRQTRVGRHRCCTLRLPGLQPVHQCGTTYHNDGATPYLRLSNPFPNGLIQPPGSSLGLLNDVGYGANGPDPQRYKINPPKKAGPWASNGNFHGTLCSMWSISGKKAPTSTSAATTTRHLGPEVENYTPDQVGNVLTTYVNNPFQGYITNPNSNLSRRRCSNFNWTSVSAIHRRHHRRPPSASSIYNALQVTAAKELLQWPAVPDHLCVVQIDRRCIGPG